MANIRLEDDTKERVSLLIKERLPWLLIGLVGGILATLLMSNFEKVLEKNLSLAFFLPVIVYMADAIGTQTENIYVRNLSKFKDNFWKYLGKEIFIGLSFGIIFGLLLAAFANLWLRDINVAKTVGLAMLINGTLAPIVALVVSEIIFKEHEDPALGAGPFTTVIQDLISLSIYLCVAAVIIF